jgi:hypothetical protein
MLKSLGAEPASHCAMATCHKEKQEKPKDCTNCNPFMGCSLCNFFIGTNQEIEINTTRNIIQKNSANNDNRVATRSSEFWHPPELA